MHYEASIASLQVLAPLISLEAEAPKLRQQREIKLVKMCEHCLALGLALINEAKQLLRCCLEAQAQSELNMLRSNEPFVLE